MNIKNIVNLGFRKGILIEASRGDVKALPIFKRIFKFLNIPNAEPGCCESDLTYLPTGYNKIDNTPVYYDPETDTKVPYSGGGDGDQNNIMRVVQVTLDDLGLDETATDEDVKIALAAYIDGMEVAEDEIPYFQVEGFPDSGGGGGGSQDLQETLINGNESTETIILNINETLITLGNLGREDGLLVQGVDSMITVESEVGRIDLRPSFQGIICSSDDEVPGLIIVNDTPTVNSSMQIGIKNLEHGSFLNLEVPNKPTGEYTIATTDDLSYSTDEIKTGGTWIDGKPVYRKVITSTMDITQEGNILIVDVDAEKIINTIYQFEIFPLSGHYNTAPFRTFESGVQFDIYVSVENDGINETLDIRNNTYNYTTSEPINYTDVAFTLIAEYTKTTD